MEPKERKHADVIAKALALLAGSKAEEDTFQVQTTGKRAFVNEGRYQRQFAIPYAISHLSKEIGSVATALQFTPEIYPKPHSEEDDLSKEISSVSTNALQFTPEKQASWEYNQKLHLENNSTKVSQIKAECHQKVDAETQADISVHPFSLSEPNIKNVHSGTSRKSSSSCKDEVEYMLSSVHTQGQNPLSRQSLLSCSDPHNKADSETICELTSPYQQTLKRDKLTSFTDRKSPPFVIKPPGLGVSTKICQTMKNIKQSSFSKNKCTSPIPLAEREVSKNSEFTWAENKSPRSLGYFFFSWKLCHRILTRWQIYVREKSLCRSSLNSWRVYTHRSIWIENILRENKPFSRRVQLRRYMCLLKESSSKKKRMMIYSTSVIKLTVFRLAKNYLRNWKHAFIRRKYLRRNMFEGWKLLHEQRMSSIASYKSRKKSRILRTYFNNWSIIRGTSWVCRQRYYRIGFNLFRANMRIEKLEKMGQRLLVRDKIDEWRKCVPISARFKTIRNQIVNCRRRRILIIWKEEYNVLKIEHSVTYKMQAARMKRALNKLLQHVEVKQKLEANSYKFSCWKKRKALNALVSFHLSKKKSLDIQMSCYSFALWRKKKAFHYIARHALQRQRIRDVKRKRRVYKLSYVFREWYAYTLSSKLVTRHAQFRSLKRSFSLWLTYYQSNQKKHMLLEKHYRYSIMRPKFYIWISFVNNRKRYRNLILASVTHYKQRQVKRFLSLLQGKVQRRKRIINATIYFNVAKKEVAFIRFRTFLKLAKARRNIILGSKNYKLRKEFLKWKSTHRLTKKTEAARIDYQKKMLTIALEKLLEYSEIARIGRSIELKSKTIKKRNIWLQWREKFNKREIVKQLRATSTRRRLVNIIRYWRSYTIISSVSSIFSKGYFFELWVWNFLNIQSERKSFLLQYFTAFKSFTKARIQTARSHYVKLCFNRFVNCVATKKKLRAFMLSWRTWTIGRIQKYQNEGKKIKAFSKRRNMILKKRCLKSWRILYKERLRMYSVQRQKKRYVCSELRINQRLNIAALVFYKSILLKRCWIWWKNRIKEIKRVAILEQLKVNFRSVGFDRNTRKNTTGVETYGLQAAEIVERKPYVLGKAEKASLIPLICADYSQNTQTISVKDIYRIFRDYNMLDNKTTMVDLIVLLEAKDVYPNCTDTLGKYFSKQYDFALVEELVKNIVNGFISLNKANFQDQDADNHLSLNTVISEHILPQMMHRLETNGHTRELEHPVSGELLDQSVIALFNSYRKSLEIIFSYFGNLFDDQTPENIVFVWLAQKVKLQPERTFMDLDDSISLSQCLKLLGCCNAVPDLLNQRQVEFHFLRSTPKCKRSKKLCFPGFLEFLGRVSLAIFKCESPENSIRMLLFRLDSSGRLFSGENRSLITYIGEKSLPKVGEESPVFKPVRCSKHSEYRSCLKPSVNKLNVTTASGVKKKSKQKPKGNKSRNVAGTRVMKKDNSNGSNRQKEKESLHYNFKSELLCDEEVENSRHDNQCTHSHHRDKDNKIRKLDRVYKQFSLQPISAKGTSTLTPKAKKNSIKKNTRMSVRRASRKAVPEYKSPLSIPKPGFASVVKTSPSRESWGTMSPKRQSLPRSKVLSSPEDNNCNGLFPAQVVLVSPEQLSTFGSCHELLNSQTNCKVSVDVHDSETLSVNPMSDSEEDDLTLVMLPSGTVDVS